MNQHAPYRHWLKMTGKKSRPRSEPRGQRQREPEQAVKRADPRHSAPAPAEPQLQLL